MLAQIRMGLNGPAKPRSLRDVMLKKIGSTLPRLARLDNVEQVSVKVALETRPHALEDIRKHAFEVAQSV